MRGAPMFERLVIERLLYYIFNLLLHIFVEFKSVQYSYDLWILSNLRWRNSKAILHQVMEVYSLLGSPRIQIHRDALADLLELQLACQTVDLSPEQLDFIPTTLIKKTIRRKRRSRGGIRNRIGDEEVNSLPGRLTGGAHSRSGPSWDLWDWDWMFECETSYEHSLWQGNNIKH